MRGFAKKRAVVGGKYAGRGTGGAGENVVLDEHRFCGVTVLVKLDAAVPSAAGNSVALNRDLAGRVGDENASAGAGGRQVDGVFLCGRAADQAAFVEAA